MAKNYKLSEETKLKMSLAKKGRTPWNKGLTKDDPRVQKYSQSGWKHSEEAKLKMSLAKKDIIPWNKGKSSETDERIKNHAIKMSNREMSEEHKQKISLAKIGSTPWNKGLTIEDERVKNNVELMTDTVRKQYENGRIVWNKGLTVETDKRIISTYNGHKGLTKETSEKIKDAADKQSITMKKMCENGEIEIWNKGLTKETDARIQVSASNLSKSRIQLIKEGKLIINTKPKDPNFQVWNKGKTKETEPGLQSISVKRIYKISNEKGNWISSQEDKIANWLSSIGYIDGIDFIRQKYMILDKHSYCADFYFPKANLVFECDGIYWHQQPDRKEKDENRTKELIEKGYKIMRCTDKDINSSERFEEVKNKILGEIKNEK